MTKEILFGNSMCGHPWETVPGSDGGWCKEPFANPDGLSQRVCFSLIKRKQNDSKIRSPKNPYLPCYVQKTHLKQSDSERLGGGD